MVADQAKHLGNISRITKFSARIESSSHRPVRTVGNSPALRTEN